MRIAYILKRFWYPAGMERVITIRANVLCEEYDITIVTHNQYPHKDFYELDKRVHRKDLICSDKDYKTVLTDYLRKSKFDITVSTGGAEFFFLYSVKDGSKKIFEFHFSFDISNVWCGNIKNPIKRWLYIKGQTLKRIYFARKYDIMVVLSKTDMKKWKRFCRNVTFIYNPLTISTNQISQCNTNKVIAVGRIQEQKGFDMLVDVWNIVNKRYPDWILNIYGDGSDEKISALQKQINDKGLQLSVLLKGKTDDIVSKYLDSSIFVLSSRDEAFGLVITEAEACGLPIVAFNCPSAPAELIEDGTNGYLIKLGDIEGMAQKICLLIEDSILRGSMGFASVKLSKRFELSIIIEHWKSLYQEVLKEI